MTEAPCDLPGDCSAIANTASSCRDFVRRDFGAVHKDGRSISVRKFVSATSESEGGQTFVLVTDMTERNAREAHIKLLMGEMNHRASNLLMVVDAIARHTSRSGAAGFGKRFSERLHSLAASMNLLLKGDWRGTTIDALTRAQFAHVQDLPDTRVVTDGRRVRISSAAAQTIGMALHELLTNAIKHGALSNADGRVDVRWCLDAQGAGDERLFMSWSEIGGPPVPPPKRRGFGSMVIDSMVKTSLDADVEIAYAPTGFRWRLSCPAPASCNLAKTPRLGRTADSRSQTLMPAN